MLVYRAHPRRNLKHVPEQTDIINHLCGALNECPHGCLPEDGARSSHCPFQRILHLNRRGMVVLSRRRFKTGDRLALCLHVSGGVAKLKSGKGQCSRMSASVVGLVVDCRVGVPSSCPREAFFEVTLMFETVDHEDGEILETLGHGARVHEPEHMVTCRNGLAQPTQLNGQAGLN